VSPPEMCPVSGMAESITKHFKRRAVVIAERVELGLPIFLFALSLPCTM